jgi:hypothetical protein
MEIMQTHKYTVWLNAEFVKCYNKLYNVNSRFNMVNSMTSTYFSFLKEKSRGMKLWYVV